MPDNEAHSFYIMLTDSKSFDLSFVTLRRKTDLDVFRIGLGE